MIALGTSLVLAVIAATIAEEQAGEPTEKDAPQASGWRGVLERIQVPSALGMREAAPVDPATAATDSLRESVDRYLDARADALRALAAAREQGVDPAVLSAMGAVLGMPTDDPSPHAPSVAPQEPTIPIDTATAPHEAPRSL